MRYLIAAVLVAVTAFDNFAIAEDKGTCPTVPPITSQKRMAHIDVGATSVAATAIAVISDTGYVCDVRLLQKADKKVALDVASAIRQWHFDPAMKDGHKVPTVVTIKVNVRRDEAGKIVVSKLSD